MYLVCDNCIVYSGTRVGVDYIAMLRAVYKYLACIRGLKNIPRNWVHPSAFIFNKGNT